MNLFLLESRRTDQQIAETEEKKRTAEAELHETEDAFLRTKQEYEEIEEQLAELDAVIQQARDTAAGDALKKQQLENQIELLQEQLHSAGRTGSIFRAGSVRWRRISGAGRDSEAADPRRAGQTGNREKGSPPG